MPSQPLLVAEHALLEERRPLTREARSVQSVRSPSTSCPT